jgi:predicted ATP-dependent endonuclease of OLD family
VRYVAVTVENFRCIRSARVPLSNFVCAVGHNNAGKSSLLIALRLFYSGHKIDRADCYDPRDDVAIAVEIERIEEQELGRLGKPHADKIRPLVKEGRLTLVRRYGQDGKSSLRCLRLVPRNPRFQKEAFDAALTGSGKALRESVLAAYPELTEHVSAATKTQAHFRELIDSLAKDLPLEDFVWQESELPSGIDASVLKLLPEPLYIPAVQDVRDELKTAETAGFGKILAVLMTAIQESGKVEEVTRSFAELNRLMNRTIDEHSGETVDERLDELKLIESTVERYLTEQFRGIGVKLEVPPPSLKSVLGSARLVLDDGIEGDVESKGDGVKRAVLFALFRTLLELKRSHGAASQDERRDAGYQFLFEEPELYLHPNGQRILYDALVQLSVEHQVCVSTHSPYFFSPDDRGTFLRVRKSQPAAGAPPAAEITPVNLEGMVDLKDAYQIICYENNSAAFFCDRVILVEGDCDIIFLQHVARKLNRKWDFLRRNLAIVRIGGKGNFCRYRRFFESFGVEVRIVADLDVLVDQFGKLGAGGVATGLRDRLLQQADQIIERENIQVDVPTDALKGLVQKRGFRERYEQVRESCRRLRAGATVDIAELPEVDDLFPLERSAARRQLITSHPELTAAKRALLDELRREGINVLSAGAIECYYPEGCDGPDKPSRALAACQRVVSREDALACSAVLSQPEGPDECELDVVFGNLFATPLAVDEVAYPVTVAAELPNVAGQGRTPAPPCTG